jgi:hypothetical protein
MVIDSAGSVIRWPAAADGTEPVTMSELAAFWTAAL